MPPARGEGWRCSPHTHAAAQPGTAEEGGGRRRPDGPVLQPRPAGEPVFSQGNQPRCRRGAGDGALPACSRRAASRLTVALLHLPPPPAPGSARPRRGGPARSFRLAPAAAEARGRGAHARPPALGSRLSPRLPPKRRSSQPDARSAGLPAPSYPLAPHLTRPGTTAAPRRLPLWSRGGCPGLPPVRSAVLTLRAVGRPPAERGSPCRRRSERRSALGRGRWDPPAQRLGSPPHLLGAG